MYYAIRETLESCETLPASPYVAVMNVAEWQAKKDTFDLGIDLEMSLSKIYGTKAEVNYDSLTGTFSIIIFDFSAELKSNAVFFTTSSHPRYAENEDS